MTSSLNTGAGSGGRIPRRHAIGDTPTRFENPELKQPSDTYPIIVVISVTVSLVVVKSSFARAVRYSVR